MSKFSRLISSATLFAILLLTSCQKDSLGDASVSGAAQGEGTLSVNYALSRLLSDSDIMDESTLRLYSVDEDDSLSLVRWWRPASSVDSEIYLVAGEYLATVESGSSVDLTVDENHLYYSDEQPFTIVAQQRSEVDLTLKMENVKVGVAFDKTIDTIFDKGYKFYYAARNSVSSADSAQSEVDAVTSICFDSDSVAYFILPDSVSNISWWFYGESSDSDIADNGMLSQVGSIKDVERSTSYSMTLKYSPSADGYLDLSLSIDDSADITNTTISFSPRPTFTGANGLSLQKIYRYYSASPESESITVTGMNPISDVSVELPTGEIITPYAGGQIVSVEGVSYTPSDSGKTGELKINTSLFSGVTHGGESKVLLSAVDSKGSAGSGEWKFCTQGFITSPNFDFWNNSAYFSVALTEEYTSTEFRIREVGGEWSSLPLTKVGEYLYSAEVAAQWEDVKYKDISYGGANADGLDAFKLVGGIFAGVKYEYALYADGVEIAAISGEFQSESSDMPAIPSGNINDSNLLCFGTSAESSTSWASGNNSSVDNLCKYGSSGDNGYAVLTSSETLDNLGSGNIIFGTFNMISEGSMVGIKVNGSANFGQKFGWKARPRAFRFRYRAKLGTINTGSNNSLLDLENGEQDNAIVQMVIMDWSSRKSVISGKSVQRGMWTPETTTKTAEGAVIGYATYRIKESNWDGSSTSDSTFETVEIPILYYDKDSKPSSDSYNLTMQAANSIYGDYMLGCSSNLMHIDDFELVY